MSDYKFNNDAIVKDTLVESFAQAGVNVMLGASQVRGIEVSRGKQNTYPVEVNEDSERKETLILKTDNANSIELDCKIDCSNTKNIVSTAINGLNGTIKEWIAEGDVAINVEVTLLGEGNQYPTEKVERLTALLRKNESLQIENETLNNVYGVERIVITSWGITPTKAFNYQTISFNAVSDKVYKIETNIIQ
jgi:hypothetical protein